MAIATISRSPGQMVLKATTAGELMTPNPVSLLHNMTVRDAAAFLTAREISAAPVIDAAGRPVGVLSRTDLVRHSERIAHEAAAYCDFYSKAELQSPKVELEPERGQPPSSETPVSEIMTPAVLSVTPESPALEVVAQMLAWKVHRLFVQDESGVLVGVVSALDILRQLRKR